jgi:hypothetical protein
MLVFDGPFIYCRQDLFNSPFISYEIVIYEIDMTAIAKVIKILEFTDDLLRCFRSRLSAIEFNNIAKLAIKGTATRELYSNLKIIFKSN